MKDFLLKFFTTAFGSSVASFLARIIIALLMLLTGATTNFGDAVGIAVDKDRSLAAAAVLINQTGNREIQTALENEDVVLLPTDIAVAE